MPEILHQLLLKASPNRVYQALTEQKGLAHWWIQYVSCEPRLDSIAEFEFAGGKIKVRMKILKLLPNRTVVWHCLAGPTEWIGTQITFNLPQPPRNALNFSHRGWRSQMNTLPMHNFEWARHLMSLRAYLEKGKGYPIKNERYYDPTKTNHIKRHPTFRPSHDWPLHWSDFSVG